MVTPLRDEAGNLRGFVKVARDMTEHKRAEDALRESEERLRFALDSAQMGAWDLDLVTNTTLRSLRHDQIFGYNSLLPDWNYETFLAHVHPDDRESVDHKFKHALARGEEYNMECRVIWPDQSVHWISAQGHVYHDQNGKLIRVSGVVTDITERKVVEDRMAHEASHDALTNLPNRALFTEHLNRAIARAKRHPDYLFAVLFLDLDRFKVINDSLGHVVADQLLVAIARKLEHCVRPEDIVARLGGDEFTILVDDIKDSSDATRVANRIHKELATPFNLDGHEVFTSTSIGITLSSQCYDRPEDCLRDADTAMYRAKSLGKARHEIFDKSMHTHVVALLRLETDLRRALEGQEFRIHYQPFVSLETGRITGFEALVRWQHPERGPVAPAEFIPVAEENGLIVPIGRWVLHEACRQLRSWQAKFSASSPLSISVNLCGKQFSQPDLIELIKGILGETGLDAHSLKLEITESVVMQNAAAATAILSQLRDMGVKLHIDDFGTGYSSLSYLQRFPVDMLKIDRSFISRMNTDGNLEIVRTIVTLAHHLDMEVMAEGVETAEQLAQLRALKCEYGQGYFFSRPVEAEAALALLAM